MVAEHGDGAAAETDDAAEHSDGIGPPVDEVADEPQRIARRLKLDLLEQLVELLGTALQIADCVRCHRGTVPTVVCFA